MNEIIETERLILRKWALADVAALFEICRHSDVMRHIGDGKPFDSIADAEKFLKWAVKYQSENKFCRWAVAEKSSGAIVGSCGFARQTTGEIELGYLFARQSWGKGFATEAARSCVEYGFNKLKFSKIIALTDFDHAESHRVLEKTGFSRRGVEKYNDVENLVFEIVDSNQL